MTTREEAIYKLRLIVENGTTQDFEDALDLYAPVYGEDIALEVLDHNFFNLGK